MNLFSLLIHYTILLIMLVFFLQDTYVSIYNLAPIKHSHNWVTLIVGVIATDFVMYWIHYLGHMKLWPLHCPHHSSNFFNISTGFRQSWIFTIVIAFLALPFGLVGIPFETLIVILKIIFTYSIYVHTQYIHRLPKVVEFIFMSPAFHRVHHGSNPDYTDKNFGGLLIIWDRLFGTFADEKEAVKYGIRQNHVTNNPFRIQFEPIQSWLRKKLDHRKTLIPK